jgi:hypothetical protein
MKVNSSAGQRTVVVYAEGKMGFICEAELICDPKSESEKCHDIMNSIKK